MTQFPARRTHRSHARSVAAAAAATTLVLAAAGCAKEDTSGQTSSGAKVVQAGKLTLCTHMSYKPFEFQQNGQNVGFDIDLIDLVSKKMGLTTAVTDIEFQQIYNGAAFQAKKCDLGIAGMTITDERKKSVDFSKPYFDATQALMVKNTQSYNDLSQLKGKKIGAQTETTGLDYLKAREKQMGFTLVVFQDFPSEANAVKAGKIDAGVNDNGVVFDFAKDNPDTKVTKEFATGEQYGISFKKGDPNAQQLLKTTDEVLDQAKKDGTYAKLYQKWFNKAPAKIPGM